MIPSSCPPSPRTVAWMRCTAPVSAEIPFPTGPYWDRHREAQRGRVQPCGAPLRSDGSACTSPARHPGPAGKIQLYATATNTRRNLDAMHRQGCRVLMGPDQLSRWSTDTPPLAWALDNGAYGCWKAGKPFDAEAFAATVARWGDGADWIVAPDIVAGGSTSLALSLAWLPRLLPIAPVLIAVQDGMEPADVAPPPLRPGGNFRRRFHRMEVALASELGCAGCACGMPTACRESQQREGDPAVRLAGSGELRRHQPQSVLHQCGAVWGGHQGSGADPPSVDLPAATMLAGGLNEQDRQRRRRDSPEPIAAGVLRTRRRVYPSCRWEERRFSLCMLRTYAAGNKPSASDLPGWRAD